MADFLFWYQPLLSKIEINKLCKAIFTLLLLIINPYFIFKQAISFLMRDAFTGTILLYYSIPTTFCPASQLEEDKERIEGAMPCHDYLLDRGTDHVAAGEWQHICPTK